MVSTWWENDTLKLIFPVKKELLVLLIIIVGIASTAMVSGVVPDNYNNTTNTSPEVKVIDVSSVIDVSQIGEIPLGQIPDERISITTSVVNTGKSTVSGLRIKTFLVKEGREDTISAQLGSDFRNAEFKPGEVKSFKMNYMVSKNLKPGNYKVMIRIDSDITGQENNPDFLQYISDQIVKIGAYADAGGSIPVYSPNSIDTPGSYLLMRNIQGGDRNNIFKISCSGVTIDGGGYSIQGVPSGFTSGIYVDGGSIIQNVIIKNCVFEGVDFGVWFYRVEGGSIINCTFKDCKNIGIRLDQSRANTITDNTLTGNVLGIGVFQSSGNKISNNYLKNQFNAAANDDLRNFWSTDLQAGTNIAGGSTKGGNIWLDSNGTGFSATNPDINHDGIVDTPYSINGNNIDYYPLSMIQTEKTQLSTDSIPTSGQEPIPDSADRLNSSDIHPSNVQENNISPVATGISPVETPIEKQSNSVEGSADLVISALNATESSCITSEFPVTSTIENRGDIEADYFSIHYYLSDDQGITPSDKEIGYHQVESLKPHEKQEFTDSLKVPAETSIKSYSLGAIVDPSNDIYEKNKENNIALLNHSIQIKDC